MKVLINGAAGNVGTFAVQIAKAYGADVTGVDRAEKLELMRSSGADRAIDYTQEDFTRGPERYDIILDVASNLSLSDCKRVLAPQGTYGLVGHDHFGTAGGRWLGSMLPFFRLVVLSRFVTYLSIPNFSADYRSLMATLKELSEAGKISPIIDRTFPLSEAADALRYLQDGQARGSVIIVP
jgi:NADPH:quinone reductase-like Zn-dependent oxidoreductase